MITLPEAKIDLANVVIDIHNLTRIVEGLKNFKTRSRGEDRSFLRMDLMKYENLQFDAFKLKQKIEAKIKELESAN